jgi:hypothetical protein
VKTPREGEKLEGPASSESMCNQNTFSGFPRPISVTFSSVLSFFHRDNLANASDKEVSYIPKSHSARNMSFGSMREARSMTGNADSKAIVNTSSAGPVSMTGSLPFTPYNNVAI